MRKAKEDLNSVQFKVKKKVKQVIKGNFSNLKNKKQNAATVEKHLRSNRPAEKSNLYRKKTLERR